MSAKQVKAFIVVDPMRGAWGKGADLKAATKAMRTADFKSTVRVVYLFDVTLADIDVFTGVDFEVRWPESATVMRYEIDAK